MGILSIEKEKPTGFQIGIIIFFTVAAISINMLDFIYLLNFNTDSSVVLHNPLAKKKYPPTFTAAGFAWDRDSIKGGDDIKVTIHLTRVSDNKNLSFNTKRSSVRRKETVLFHLSSFSSTIALPDMGKIEDWNIFARMTTPSGVSLETPPRRISIDPRARSREFRFLSIEHIISLLSILIGAVIICLLFLNNRNKDLRPVTALILVYVLWINEFIYHIYWNSIGAWSPIYTIMLHMCGLTILIIPYALFIWKKKIRQYLAEIIYFWGLGGALQGLLTPDINVHGFPEYKFFTLFISHGCIIFIALFIIIAYNIRIGLWSYIRVFFITNAAVILYFIINPLFKYIAPFEPANYFFLSYPPPDGSIIDLFVQIFGPSPWYLIGMELMGLVIFFLLCLPFMFKKKAGSKGISE